MHCYGYVVSYVSLIQKLFSKALLMIDRFHIVPYIGQTFLSHRIKETTSRLKHSSQNQQRTGRKLKRY
ncbi:MAG: transposase [Enterococcus lacertideformus]|uniref:Transposase n=1 Tax=Enterococcus lacertideformus TaxID=2771493 RepID=A0A931FBK4_9ENTE|nr:transposase [Enterococcus lacertideformus]